MRERKGTWIAFEGGDGSGKTTIVNRVAQRLRDVGLPVHQTRAPGGTLVGSKLRQLLVDDQPKMGALTEELIHAADMAQLCHELSELPDETIIVTDRSVLSSYAYSTWGKENPKHWEYIFALTEDVRTPDAYIFLDVDPVLGKQRSSAARGQDVIAAYDNATLDFYSRIQKAFRTMMLDRNDLFSATINTTFYNLDEVEWLTMIEVWRILANLGVEYPEPFPNMRYPESFTVTTV